MPQFVSPAVRSEGRVYETIIIGAGIAGLACARHLQDAGQPFLIVSENLGGRIRRSRNGDLNLGAYYVRADYTHVNRFVELGRRLDRLAVQRHDGDSTYTYRDRRFLLHVPQVARFLVQLVRFHRRYNVLKQRTIQIGQAAAIRTDPTLWRLYRQPAEDFVEQHRLRELAHWYLEPGLHGTAFTSLHDVNAFTLLLSALPVLVPAYEFTPQFHRLVTGFTDAIVADTVTGLESHGDRYNIETETNGALTARRVVIATPTDVAGQLIGRPTTKRPVNAHMFQVAGLLRDPYRQADLHLFSESDPTLAIARQRGGTVLVSSRERHPDFDRYFIDWRLVEHRHWNPAFHLRGDDLLECEQGPGLYLIGDHNIVGLEDAYLTGLYAARQIISGTSSLGTRLHFTAGQKA
jgi:glycine/D-amino acid oxidase-like deaminating enzyme